MAKNPFQGIETIMKKTLESQAQLAEAMRTIAGDQARREGELVSLLGIALATLAKSQENELNMLVMVLERQLEIRKESGAPAHDLSSAEALVAAIRLMP